MLYLFYDVEHSIVTVSDDYFVTLSFMIPFIRMFSIGKYADKSHIVDLVLHFLLPRILCNIEIQVNKISAGDEIYEEK